MLHLHVSHLVVQDQLEGQVLLIFEAPEGQLCTA